MTAIPHGDIFKYLKDIRTDGEQTSYESRIPILMLLISTADKRLQTWHSTESIMKYTGFSKSPVTDALNWFESRGAIYNVPKETRIGHAKRIHGNRKVWQLTGILQLGQGIIDYIYLNDEDRQSSLLEIADNAPKHVIDLFKEKGLLPENKDLGSENELNLGLQNDTQIIEIGLQSEPEIGLQNGTTKELSKENLVKIEEISNPQADTAKQDTDVNSTAKGIITVYLKQTKTVNGKAYAFWMSDAQELARHGIKPAHVAEWIKQIHDSVTFKGEPSWSYMCSQIRSWHDANNKAPARPGDAFFQQKLPTNIAMLNIIPDKAVGQ